MAISKTKPSDHEISKFHFRRVNNKSTLPNMPRGHARAAAAQRTRCRLWPSSTLELRWHLDFARLQNNDDNNNSIHGHEQLDPG